MSSSRGSSRNNSGNGSEVSLRRSINLENGRSILTDDQNHRYELIPNATLAELYEISKQLPGVDIKKILRKPSEIDEKISTPSSEKSVSTSSIPKLDMEKVLNSEEKQEDARKYVRIGKGAHSFCGLARELNEDGSTKRYLVVKKVQSSDELSAKHYKNALSSPRSNLNSPMPSPRSSTVDSPRISAPNSPRINALTEATPTNVNSAANTPLPTSTNPHRQLSKSTSLITRVTGDTKRVTRSLSNPPDLQHAVEAKQKAVLERKAILQSIENEKDVMALVANVKGLCITESQISSSKKKSTPEQPQLYQFLQLAELGNLATINDIFQNAFDNNETVPTKSSYAKANKIRLNIANQMIGIVLDLHCKTQVCHRDIMLDNFLLTKDGKVLLIDFGCAAYPDAKNKDQWKFVTTAEVRNENHTPPVFLKTARSGAHGFYRLEDEWALAKALLDLFQISTDELIDMYVRSKKNENIKFRHNAYILTIRKQMRAALIPKYMRKIIRELLEINPEIRKEHIREIVTQPDLLVTSNPDMSKELKKIHYSIAVKNEAYFNKENPEKYNELYFNTNPNRLKPDVEKLEPSSDIPFEDGISSDDETANSVTTTMPLELELDHDGYVKEKPDVPPKKEPKVDDKGYVLEEKKDETKFASLIKSPARVFSQPKIDGARSSSGSVTTINAEGYVTGNVENMADDSPTGSSVPPIFKRRPRK